MRSNSKVLASVDRVIDSVESIFRKAGGAVGVVLPGHAASTGTSPVAWWKDPLGPLDVGCVPLAKGWFPNGETGDAARFKYQDMVGPWVAKARAAYEPFVKADPFYFFKLANAWGDAYGLPRGIMGAILKHESGGKPWAWNPGANRESSAMGLGQVVYTTARGLGIPHTFQVSANLDAMAKLIQTNIKRAGGDVNKAMSMYAGKPLAETTLDEFVQNYSGESKYFA
jgi:hypothetical protein